MMTQHFIAFARQIDGWTYFRYGLGTIQKGTAQRLAYVGTEEYVEWEKCTFTNGLLTVPMFVYLKCLSRL